MTEGIEVAEQKGNKIMTNQNKIKSLVPDSRFGTEFENRSSQNVFFNTCFDKNHLKTLIAWFLEQYGEKVTVDLVETLKQVGFHQATRAGVSLGVDDLKIPPQKNALLSQASLKMNQVNNAIQTGNLTSVEKSQRLIDTWNQTSETLRQTAVHNFRTTNPVNPVYMMAFSGARGNISQVRQLVAMRGLMADPQGAILEFPIQSNFREGLTVTEYLISCYGARKGLVDTALRTATSGYLTRRLVDAVQHVVVHVKDCQTTKGIVIKDKNLEQRLLGRVLFEDVRLNTLTLKKNTLITHRLAKQLASKYNEIVVRSPLTCKTEKSVCQLCYGLDLSQGKLVSIGEAVGIIAAQSIGEPGTQLTMRTFHTGGVGVFSDQAMKSFTAPFEGRIEFSEPLSGLFVRTPHGNIVYLLKHKTVDKTKPLLKLISVQPAQNLNNYQILHCDVPSGSLLWVKQGECVKTGQLLLQASRLQTTTQEMPESSHPVRSPISGEIFFQSMSIRIVEEEKRLVPKTKKKKQQSTGSSQINQKEVSPKFPTLIELGNFWIFSTFVQKENRICNSFFVNGDLVSSETPIQQYNLHLLYTGQLKRVNSSVVFGQNAFQFLFSKIQYSGLFYFLENPIFNFEMSLEKQKIKSNLLIYTSNSKSTILTWYPFFKKPVFQFSGYCLIFPGTNFDKVGKENEFSSLKNDLKTASFGKEIQENLKGASNQKPTLKQSSDLNYLWSPHKVFEVKITSDRLTLFEKTFVLEQNKLVSFCSFVLSQTSKVFSKIGVFQFESNNKIQWNIKTQFQGNFIKNCRKNSTKHHVKQTQSQGLSNHPGVSTKFHPDLQFVKNGLSVSNKNVFGHFSAKVIHKKQVWAYIPKTSVSENVFSQLAGIVLEPGKPFESSCFTNSYISADLIHTRNFRFLKSKTTPLFSFYSFSNILAIKRPFRTPVLTSKPVQHNFEKTYLNTEFNALRELNDVKLVELKYFNRESRKFFCFYKTDEDFEFKKVVLKIQKYRRLSHVLLFQKNYHQFLSPENFLKQNWFLQKKYPAKIVINSPLFAKQYKTTRQKNRILVKESKPNLKPTLKILSPTSSGWFSLSTFFKIEMSFNTSNCFEKSEQFKQNRFVSKTTTSAFPKNEISPKNKVFGKGTNIKKFLTSNHITSYSTSPTLDPSSTIQNEFKTSFEKIGKNKPKNTGTSVQTLALPGFTLFFYQRVKLENSNQFEFLTFSNGWVLPEWKITEAFLTSKKLGEFRSTQENQKQTAFSLLQTQHRTTLKLPSQQNQSKVSQLKVSQLKVGRQVRWGQELFQGYAVQVSGQILKTTEKTLTLRKGIPLLASIRGLVHISHKDFVEKNDLLITLRSRRLQTEDIVQGIPKIEQLFEARETQGGEVIQNNMHTLLNNFFIRARQVRPFDEAVELSLTYIQKFLVENILEAYSNQGVTIAEKHVEIVVRQMTARVRITHGGDSGFLPGEFVQLRWIEKVNLTLGRLGRREAQYEPVILGITKSVLQSESFLVAASFQQVSKVLVRSALAKKTDFLRGLHENILVGQPIPAGTGMIALTQSLDKSKTQDSVESLE